MPKSRILIVDDEKINIDVLRGALQSDYLVQAAKNGNQALEIAVETPPNMILLDIMMPGMDGYEVCKQLKSDDKTKQIPIIFLTAMSDSCYETKGLDLGAIDYITKPINVAIVKARVKHHLERDEYKNHLEELVDKRTEELSRTKEELRIANNAKGEFLMNMSHELRTPLSGVLNASDLISTCETKEELDEIRNIINSCGNSLLKTVEQILDFIRSKDGELELKASFFRLDEALSKTKTKFFHKGTYLNLETDFDIDSENLPNRLVGDEERLIEILNHLLDNAAKFTSKPPKATLNIKILEKTDEDVILKFSLTDNGIGIAESQFQNIFQPFSQIDTTNTRQYDGIGMGLSICKQLVELMGGQIRVASEQSKGSTFSFTLRFKRQQEDEPFNFDLLKSIQNVDKKSNAQNRKEHLIGPDIERILPIIKNLDKALFLSDPNKIQSYMKELKGYDIPRRTELIQRVNDYEYDEAMSILKEIDAAISNPLNQD